mmetsp:Transcript_12170/g.32751  ORF Transcript_12170/g.32751 Transcript_12170/m.32751 type:complete len:1148 (-) Transcript_12170:70-3513(-)
MFPNESETQDNAFTNGGPLQKSATRQRREEVQRQDDESCMLELLEAADALLNANRRVLALAAQKDSQRSPESRTATDEVEGHGVLCPKRMLGHVLADVDVQKCAINVAEVSSRVADAVERTREQETEAIRAWEERTSMIRAARKHSPWRRYEDLKPSELRREHFNNCIDFERRSEVDVAISPDNHDNRARRNMRHDSQSSAANSFNNFELLDVDLSLVNAAPKVTFAQDEVGPRAPAVAVAPLNLSNLSFGSIAVGSGLIGAPGDWPNADNGWPSEGVIPAEHASPGHTDSRSSRTGQPSTEVSLTQPEVLLALQEPKEPPRFDVQILHRDYALLYSKANDFGEAAGEEAARSLIEVSAGEFFRKGRRCSDIWNMGAIQLGAGGFSRVELADERGGLKRKAAVKIMYKSSVTYSESRVSKEIFAMRVIALAGGHPKIVALYEVFEEEEKVCIVMERIDGGDLFSHLSDEGYYTEVTASLRVKDMLEASAFCHRLNIAHRDIKPENFVFQKPLSDLSESSELGCLKMIDFGISFYSEEPDMLTKTLIGTPHYVSPEVLFCQEYIGAEADMWSLGIIAYMLLSGAPPFDDDDLRKLVRAVKYDPVAFHGSGWVAISEPAKDFISRLLTKDPVQRMTAQEALVHPWIVDNDALTKKDLLMNVQDNIETFQRRLRWRKGINAVLARNRIMVGIWPRVVAETAADESADTSGPPAREKTQLSTQQDSQDDYSRQAFRDSLNQFVKENRARQLQSQKQRYEEARAKHEYVLRTKHNPLALKFPGPSVLSEAGMSSGSVASALSEEITGPNGQKTRKKVQGRATSSKVLVQAAKKASPSSKKNVQWKLNTQHQSGHSRRESRVVDRDARSSLDAPRGLHNAASQTAGDATTTLAGGLTNGSNINGAQSATAQRDRSFDACTTKIGSNSPASEEKHLREGDDDVHKASDSVVKYGRKNSDTSVSGLSTLEATTTGTRLYDAHSKRSAHPVSQPKAAPGGVQIAESAAIKALQSEAGRGLRRKISSPLFVRKGSVSVAHSEAPVQLRKAVSAKHLGREPREIDGLHEHALRAGSPESSSGGLIFGNVMRGVGAMLGKPRRGAVHVNDAKQSASVPFDAVDRHAPPHDAAAARPKPVVPSRPSVTSAVAPRVTKPPH